MRIRQPSFPPRLRQHRDTAPAERAERTSVNIACILLVNGTEEQALLEDYTTRGFRVRCRKTLFVGSEISIVMPGCHPVQATVRWSLGGSTGCLFRVPVNSALIRSITASV
jgi:hypothetical protein